MASKTVTEAGMALTEAVGVVGVAVVVVVRGSAGGLALVVAGERRLDRAADPGERGDLEVAIGQPVAEQRPTVDRAQLQVDADLGELVLEQLAGLLPSSDALGGAVPQQQLPPVLDPDAAGTFGPAGLVEPAAAAARSPRP